MAHWSGKWIKEIPLPSEKLSAAHGSLLFYSTMTDGVEHNAGARSYQLWREEVRRRGRAAGSDPRTWWIRLRKVLQLTGPQAVAILVPCSADTRQDPTGCGKEANHYYRLRDQQCIRPHTCYIGKLHQQSERSISDISKTRMGVSTLVPTLYRQ